MTGDIESLKPSELVHRSYKMMLEHLSQETDAVGIPLKDHSIAVAELVKKHFGPGWEKDATEDDYVAVAYLHDVLESLDDPAKREAAARTVRERFGRLVQDAVTAITRHPSETYRAYVVRCSMNPIARRVKLCDLEHNMDFSRIESVRPLTDRDFSLLRRYEKARDLLSSKEQ